LRHLERNPMGKLIFPRLCEVPCESRCHITLLYIQQHRACLQPPPGHLWHD
jgi:hypothetical protein